MDNQEYRQIMNPKICETIIENVKLEQPHHLAVQSLCAGGYVSLRTELVFEGIVRVAQGHEVHGRAPDPVDLDTDLSAVLSSAHYKRGHRRTVCACVCILLFFFSPSNANRL